MRHRRPLIPISAIAVVAACVCVAGCGGSSPTTAAKTTKQNPLLAYSSCMRSHGVSNFPDPSGSAGIPKSEVVPLVGTPDFNSASEACAHLAPGGSLGPSAQSVPAHTAALLAFARCVRSHGFPTFPDPTKSGQMTPEMAAQAGINLRQPAVLRTAVACTSVTHGILTKAAVTRALSQANAGQ